MTFSQTAGCSTADNTDAASEVKKMHIHVQCICVDEGGTCAHIIDATLLNSGNS